MTDYRQMIEKLKRESSKTMSEIVSIAQQKMLVIHDDRGLPNPLSPRPASQTQRKSSNEISNDMGTLKQRLRLQPCAGIRRSETQDTWVSI